MTMQVHVRLVYQLWLLQIMHITQVSRLEDIHTDGLA